ncbi:formate dehydrogenase accessory sulfurtransferase FdhD [Seongchinamella sediminis]|uniref:Sulfur carrier protein FdhD n=1 Tax=Seongchinamella sediminis TaxID=2283635 RepID=A0A3L7DYX3_9GAMM|nr:formate dehydrogenase accessory sulfurtransferase FdhD [Seongchinamella sediminis]RLQ22797.1 formate dehydrogenase accessory sulfurtransferase FdhD [Seongchinamella sediminis]
MAESTVRLARTVWQQGQLRWDSDAVVQEAPVALVYNGISHAVMMATPADLADLALGFSLSERILASPGQLLGVEIEQREQGLELAMEITAEPFEGLKRRRRSLTGRSGCGLCGVESLAQASVPPRRVEADVRLRPAALQRALESLGAAQELRALTGGVHGAAWCDPHGDIRLLREDVGRHNALDKLLGAMAAQGSDRAGFVLLTSRLSYEMVAKAAACNIPVLAAVSAPTVLAVEQAMQAGISLVGFVQPGRQVMYCGEQRIMEAEG